MCDCPNRLHIDVVGTAVPIIDRSTPSDIGHCATWRRCPAGHPRRYRYRRPSIVATAKLRHCPRDDDAIPSLTWRTTKNNHHLQIHIRRRRWWRRCRCSPTVDAAGDGGGGGGGGKTIMDLFDGGQDQQYKGGGGGTGGQSGWGGSRDDDYGDCDVKDNKRTTCAAPSTYRRPSIVATAILRHCPRDDDAIPSLTRRTTKNNHHLQIHIRRRRWWRRRRCSPTVDAAGDGGGGVGGGKRIMDSLRWRSRPTIRRRRRRNRGTIAMGRQSRRRLRRL